MTFADAAHGAGLMVFGGGFVWCVLVLVRAFLRVLEELE